MTRLPLQASLVDRPIPLAPQGAAMVREMILRHDQESDRRRGERSLLSRLSRLLGRGDDAPAEKPAAWTPPYLRGRAIVRPSGLIVADGVAVIDVRGPLMDRAICWYDGEVWVEGYDRLTMMLQEAEGDEAIGAVMLRFDTPGGLVDGLESFAAAIDKVSAAGKPVHGFVGSAALSAGYWAIVSCDKVVSAPEGLVGSIGVIIMHAEYSRALAEAGVTVTAIKFGAQKDDGSWAAPLSETALTTMQQMVDFTGERFVSHVAARRGLSREAVLATEAAVIPHSDAALAGGFIDAIASEEDAFLSLAALVRGETPDAGPVAGAGTPADPAATSAATELSTEQEADMAVKTKMAAILAGKDDPETKLKALAKLAEGTEPEDEAAEGEDEDEDEMAKDKAAEDEEPEEEAAEGEDEEPKAAATGAMAAVALATSPQAKGREALARKLAAKVQAKKLTYGEAKDMLAAAPKSGRLAEAMGGRTPALGGGAPVVGEKAAEASWDKAFAKVPGAKPR